MAFYRSVRSRDLLETFFVSAITSLLLVRFYLYLTGYPQLGGGNFHIAHMLWGGLLMLASIAILLGFIGKRSQQLAAVIGGAGFGVFLDEIGKFITKDNNYFFEPAVGIIYAVFVILFLTFSFISRNTKYSSREYQLNALLQLEDAVAHDMDESERKKVRALLEKSNTRSSITVQLLKLLDDIKVVSNPSQNRLQKILARSDAWYLVFWSKQSSNTAIKAFFVAQAIIFLLIILAVQFASIEEIQSVFRGEVTYGAWLLVGEVVSAFIATGLALRGAYILASSRIEGFELFRKACLINIFLTEFFSFSRIQFDALPGFFLNLILIIAIGYVIHQERRSI